MAVIHRHQLARLTPDAWQRLLAGDWDADARDCIDHWAARGLPVVVTRQRPQDGTHAISVGLAAPRRWQSRRLAFQVYRSEVLFFDEFPDLQKICATLPGSARAPARQLAMAIRACGATARVYGSHGWQHLTGLQHVRDGSDLDLWIAVNGIDQADAVAAAMSAFAAPTRRLDGELVFDGDAAVDWREWMAWRAGRTGTVLVKQLNGPSLPRSMDAFGATAALA
jgi:phosphoribosyl-dephospho-CoA transferase